MTGGLPELIMRCLRIAWAAEAADAEALVACFAEDGAVTDEGEAWRGRAAIREWW